MHGCHDFQQWSMNRRCLMRIGSLGLAGLSLPRLLQAEDQAQAERRWQVGSSGQTYHLPAPVRRPKPHRYVRHETQCPRRHSRNIQADRQFRTWFAGL